MNNFSKNQQNTMRRHYQKKKKKITRKKKKNHTRRKRAVRTQRCRNDAHLRQWRGCGGRPRAGGPGARARASAYRGARSALGARARGRRRRAWGMSCAGGGGARRTAARDAPALRPPGAQPHTRRQNRPQQTSETAPPLRCRAQCRMLFLWRF